MADNYGLHKVVANVRVLLDDGSAAVVEGDALTTAGATAGYYRRCDAAAEAVAGFAMGDAASPSADGGTYVLMDISKEHIYRFPADAGSVTQALVGTALDIGADGRSIDINGTTTADLLVVSVDLDLNTCDVVRV